MFESVGVEDQDPVQLDRCTRDAQNPLLTYLDRMVAGHPFLCTTNLDLAHLTERFQARFPDQQSIRRQPPATEALAGWWRTLARRWSAPIRITRKIAAGARGTVRTEGG